MPVAPHDLQPRPRTPHAQGRAPTQQCRWPRASASPTISRPSPPVAPTIRTPHPSGPTRPIDSRKERDPDARQSPKFNVACSATLVRLPSAAARNHKTTLPAAAAGSRRPNRASPARAARRTIAVARRNAAWGRSRDDPPSRSEPIPSRRRLRLVLIKDRLNRAGDNRSPKNTRTKNRLR